MAIGERVSLMKAIENHRGRPLIVYATSMRSGPHASGQMSGDVIPELLDQLTLLDTGTEKDAIDVLVVSSGGDPLVAWRFMSLLRERYKKVAALVPQAAFSATTLFALGADEIVMHPNGNLGPVDPQITATRKAPGSDQPVQVNFGYEHLTGFLEFAKKEVGLTDHDHIRSLFQVFCSEVGAVPIGVAARASQLSMSMGKQLLQMHMEGDTAEETVIAIVEKLNKNYFHHGYPVSRTEAREIGLPIAPADPEIEKLIWDLWLDIEAEVKIREPFNPMTEVHNHPQAAAVITPPPTAQIPANCPPPLAQQVLQQVLNQTQVITPPPVEFELINAVMESPRHASRFKTSGKILASRSPDGQVQAVLLPLRQGWQKLDLAPLAS